LNRERYPGHTQEGVSEIPAAGRDGA